MLGAKSTEPHDCSACATCVWVWVVAVVDVAAVVGVVVAAAVVGVVVVALLDVGVVVELDSAAAVAVVRGVDVVELVLAGGGTGTGVAAG